MAALFISPNNLLGHPTIQEAIGELAELDDTIRGQLQSRVVEAGSMANDIGIRADRELSDEAMIDIALHAVSTLDPKDSATAVYHSLHGWFGGPANVPTDIKLSWENDTPATDNLGAGGSLNQRPCSSCEHHRSKSNKTPGKLIPNHHGKCTRPNGLCESNALIPEITKERGAELDRTQNTAAAVDQAVMDAEEIFRDLGRLEGVAFVATVADVAAAQLFEKIKKDKGYKNIPYVDETGKRRHITTLEEFCEVKLGKSGRRCRELSQNLTALGPDLYESAERIGFRAKDYRALKALPPEEQEIVKAAIASNSKDEVVDILQDMAARHQTEKEAAKKEKDELAADLEARSRLLENKSERLEETERELFKLKSLPPNADLELKLEREQEAVKELDQAFVTALAELNNLMIQVDTITSHDEIALHTKRYAIQTVQMYCEDIQVNLTNYGIPVDFEEMVNPAWMREAAKADHEEGHSEEAPSAPGSW